MRIRDCSVRAGRRRSRGAANRRGPISATATSAAITRSRTRSWRNSGASRWTKRVSWSPGN